MYGNTSDPKNPGEQDIDQQITLGAKIEGGPEQMLQAVADAEHDELAPTTADGQPLSFAANPRTDSRGPKYERENATSYDWTRSTRVAPGRLWGETLAGQERRRGRDDEQEAMTKRARAAAEADIRRGRSARVQAGVATPYQESTTDEEPDHDQVRPDPEADDPRAGMDADTLAAVNQAADSLAAHYGDEVHAGRPEFARRIARAVEDGQTVLGAVEGIRDTLDSIKGVRQPVGDVSPYQYRATVEGEVVSLFDHPAEGQYQAGYLEGDDGTRVKVVYWQKSKKSTGKPTLRVGDRVRLEDTRVNEWRGQPCLAIVGETEVRRLERGDGEAPRHGTSTDETAVPWWSADSDRGAWVRALDRGPTAQDGDTEATNVDFPSAGDDPAVCLICRDAFETRHGLRTHHGIVHRD